MFYMSKFDLVELIIIEKNFCDCKYLYTTQIEMKIHFLYLNEFQMKIFE